LDCDFNAKLLSKSKNSVNLENAEAKKKVESFNVECDLEIFKKDTIENNKNLLPNLEKVCFISTDKACSPVNIYGMTKAASECLMIEKSKFISSIKFVCVRYGNVLNSRGSIIPMLHKLGNDINTSHFKITDRKMTRFVMTLDQSVDLVDHALLYAESGDIVIPKLISCVVIDLIEIFSELYDKPILDGKLRPGEKMLESLINETQSKS
jgi:FlaA1/EpsC-like NDP-sugar epimerase